MMIYPTQDQLDRIDSLIRQSRDAGDAAGLARVASLLAWAIAQTSVKAITRAHARVERPDSEREADGLHKLRKGRDQCSATRRDGEQCRAPAIAGGAVCLGHGGSATQVQIAAKHGLLMRAVFETTREFETAQGTPGEFDALCRTAQARRDLEEFEARTELLAELRAEVRRMRAATDRADAGDPMETRTGGRPHATVPITDGG